MEVILQKSDKPHKKYMVKIGGRVSHFGAANYEDYTMHKDEEHKQRYIKRHEKREDWNNILSAGYWSRWLRWNKPTLQESIADMNKRFNLNIKLVWFSNKFIIIISIY